MTRATIPALLAALLLACGGGEEAETGAEVGEAGPDTLPVSVEAPVVEEGYLVVTPETVREWQESGEPFVLVDARDAVQYGREHLPGAINVSYAEIRVGGLLPPRDATIVLYCSDENCPISRYAYRSLEALGYTTLYDMKAGLQGWKSAGYPTELGDSSPAAPAGAAPDSAAG